MKAKSISPLVVLTIAGILLGGALAYTFWTSTIFTNTISVAAVFEAYANFDPSTLTFEGGSWNLEGLTIIPDFSPTNVVYVIVDKSHNLDGSGVYLNVIVGGAYETEGGRVDVSCQRMSAIWDNAPEPQVLFGYNTPEGAPIVITNVGASAPVELPGIAHDLYSHFYTTQYYQLTFSFPTTMTWGDYDCTVQLKLVD